MGIEMVENILAPAFFILELPVAMAGAPGKIVLGSGGRVKDFSLCGRWLMQQWQSRC
jgi:hypothetical protein